MINRILQLLFLLSGFASVTLCSAYRMDINGERKIKSFKSPKSLIQTDNAGTKALKQVKGVDQMKGPKSLKSSKASKDPKTLKKSEKYAVTSSSSLIIYSSKNITAATFNTNTTAQDIVGEALKQGLAHTSKSPKSPKSKSKKLATYVTSVSFVNALEAIPGTAYSKVDYDFQTMTSDPASAASTVQARINSLAVAGKLTDIMNQIDVTETYGFSALSYPIAVAYQVFLTFQYDCASQSIGDGDGIPEALRQYHVYLSEQYGQNLTNVNIIDTKINSGVCIEKLESNRRALNGESRLLRQEQVSTIDYVLEGQCTGQCPEQPIETIYTTNSIRKLAQIDSSEDEITPYEDEIPKEEFLKTALIAEANLMIDIIKTNRNLNCRITDTGCQSISSSSSSSSSSKSYSYD